MDKNSELMPDIIEVYSDGACSPNPGKGGYGYVVRYLDPKLGSTTDELTFTGSCGYVQTTNNRMELMGCLAGLDKLIDLLMESDTFTFSDDNDYREFVSSLSERYPGATIIEDIKVQTTGGPKRKVRIKLPFRELKVVSDSSYLCRGFGNGWVKGWKLKGWKTSTGETVKNIDLWQAIDGRLEEIKRRWNLRSRFICVPGHRGYKFNEICDSLAVAARKGELEADDSPEDREVD